MATLSNALSEKQGLWWLFGNRESRRAMAVLYPSAKTVDKLKQNGFELIWDSARTKATAYGYAETNAIGSFPGDETGVGFYPYACRGCDLFAPVKLYSGIVRQESNQRQVGFYGRLCDECAADDFKFTVKLVGKAKSGPAAEPPLDVIGHPDSRRAFADQP